MVDTLEAATLATLQTQVKGLENDYVDLKDNVLSLDRKVDHLFATLSNKLEGSLAVISSKLDERSRTPWTVIWTALGVGITILALLGSIVYLPLKDGQTDMHRDLAEVGKSIGELHSTYVDYREHQRLIKQIDFLEQGLNVNMVRRSEHEQHWKNTDERIQLLQHELDKIEHKN